jgi:tetratricopeptide (TPR) repeat protein
LDQRFASTRGKCNSRVADCSHGEKSIAGKRLAELDELMLGGQAELDQKRPMEARKFFRRAAEVHGEEPGVFFDIGNRLLLAGLWAEAIEYLQKSIEVAPTDGRAYPALAQCHDALGEGEKAEDVLKALLRRFGANESVHVRLAKGAIERRNWDEALLNAQGALKLNPQNQEAHRAAAAASERIYGNPQAYLSADAKPAPGAVKEIKLDL